MTIEEKRKLAQKDVGHLGEYNVYKALQGIDAKFLFNLYVPYGNSTSEIDIVMISKSGIFVIECKNYRGIINGEEDDEYWTSLSKIDYRHNDTNVNTFYNPIKQNQTHIEALSQYIKYPMHNIVCFSDMSICNIKSKSIVTQVKYINSIITNIQKQSLDIVNVDEVYNVLYPFGEVDEETKMKHIER